MKCNYFALFTSLFHQNESVAKCLQIITTKGIFHVKEMELFQLFFLSDCAIK